ncbi:neuroglobin [Biomphalaria pfeifferi]|uniref:Globin n=1 Tax=Biomphalaria pfeifferi TaxID=112525 RepID=A0AAD8C149_BIOPF|nr:neuroglobin [Biomphalaria pfeifferi]
MGCEVSTSHGVVQVVQEDEEDTGEFSDTLIDTIRSTWPLLSHDYVTVGLEVFRRIFNEIPTVRVLFDSFGIDQAETLERHQIFREHVQKFMHVLESLVENLERPEMIQPHLIALGARHAAIVGFHPEYFRFYSKCLLEVWEAELGEEFIPEVRECWEKVIDYIVRSMSHGYHICITHQLEHFVKETPIGKLV